MKKTLAILLAMLMLVMSAASVSAADEVTLAFSEPVFNEDGTVTVALDIKNNPGFYYLALTFTYDADAFESFTVENESSLLFIQGEGAQAVNVIWYANGNDNFTETGTLATITFTPVEGIPHADFEVGVVTDWTECYDLDENDVPLTLEAGVISYKHDLVHVEAVAPDCHYDGNIEYWYCNGCQTVWADEALTQITNHKNVIIPATGEGNLVHMEAVAPGCHMDGNIEYWICYECEQVWQDEALTQLTNIKNVILPALGGDVIHVPAKAPTATENGNVEHWYCEECELVWADEELTQITNHLNVIIPMTGVFGDIDGDGTVIAKDYMILKRHILGTLDYETTGITEEELLERGDIDGDGEVGAKDYMKLKRYILGSWTPSADEE